MVSNQGIALDRILNLFRVVHPGDALPPELKALQMLHRVNINSVVNIPNYPLRTFYYIIFGLGFRRFCDNVDANNKKAPVNRINMEAAWCQLLVDRCISELSGPTVRSKNSLEMLIDALRQMRGDVDDYWAQKGGKCLGMEVRHYPLDLDPPALSCDFRFDQNRRFIRMLYPGEDGYLSDIAVIRGYEEHEAGDNGQGHAQGVNGKDVEMGDAPAVEELPQFPRLVFRPAPGR